MTYLCDGVFYTLFMNTSLETPMNKGIWGFSKNYEFEPISAITVPTLVGGVVRIRYNKKTGGGSRLFVGCGVMVYLTMTLVDLVVPSEYFMTMMLRPLSRPVRRRPCRS